MYAQRTFDSKTVTHRLLTYGLSNKTGGSSY
jgi:hypothetical protein